MIGTNIVSFAEYNEGKDKVLYMPQDNQFAVLIDADNVSGKYIKCILDEISNYGLATYKRIYGDWTKPALASWKNVLLDNSILPIQQYGYTAGKNATDSAMIIDAMDILYSGNVDGFCIVSSDSDFTRLAARLRESGMIVVGMGEQKTPNAFIAACNQFKYLEILAHPVEEQKQPEPAEVEEQPQPEEEKQRMTPLDTVKKTVLSIVDEIADEDEWVFIGDVGTRLSKRFPDFDVRNYGCRKLTPFIKSLGVLDIKSIPTKDRQNKIVYVKAKNA